MPTVKVLRKLAAEHQSGSSYEDSNMFLLPLLTGQLNQTHDAIEDASISGEAFMPIPQQGGKHVEGAGISLNLDVISLEPIFNGLFSGKSGAGTSGDPVIYTLGNENANALSIATLDSVNCGQYTSAFVKRVAFASSANALWTMDADFVALSQARVAVGNFPAAPTAFDEPFTFHEAGGTNGYIRVGDSVDALAAGDNFCFEDFNLEINNGFDVQFTNCGTDTLIPVFGMTIPTISGSFTVARHSSDTWLDWQDNHTPLQMEINIYKTAAKILKLQVPRFVITTELSDDDLTKVNVTTNIGRNGTGATPINTFMNFVSPVRASIVNQ